MRASNGPVTLNQSGSVAIVTLARPARRNTLDEATLAALQSVIDTLGADRETRVIVLTATGPAFCAGHDLKEMSARRVDPDGGKAYFSDVMATCAMMMRSIVACPKPVIAAVQAAAVAAGCQLVATCDLAVAASSAAFGATGINNGLFCSTPSVALARNVPRKRAMELLLTGDMMTAAEAVATGLINRVVPDDQLMPATLALAERIARQSPAAIALGKAEFYQQAEAATLADAYAIAAEAMVRNWMFHDAQEGIGAFIDKRPPVWRGE